MTPGDYDFFRITVDGPGRMLVYSSGSTDTYGRLEDRFGRTLADDDDGGQGNNFRIQRNVNGGTYYILVRGFRANVTGSYTLHVRYTATSSGGGGTPPPPPPPPPPGDAHRNTPADPTRIAHDTNTYL
ncbi:MAG: hypothetical protein OXI20_12730, partial [Rhodospirillales bacterium]|nr:hypothetical protein [Rhodospirillales bacterium]